MGEKRLLCICENSYLPGKRIAAEKDCARVEAKENDRKETKKKEKNDKGNKRPGAPGCLAPYSHLSDTASLPHRR